MQCKLIGAMWERDIDSDRQFHSLRSKFRVSVMLKDLTIGSLREGVGSR